MLRRERHGCGAERVEVAIDRTDRDAEALGECFGAHPGASASELFGDGKRAPRPLHRA